MTVTIRDFTEADLDWAVDLLVEWDPAAPADAYRRVLTGEAATMTRCRVAQDGDERRGLAAIVEFEGVWRPMVSVVVERGHRGAGIGSLLMADTIPHVTATEAASGMPDDDEVSLGIAQHWGFEVLGHGVESVVDLADRPPMPDLPADVRLLTLSAADLPDDVATALEAFLDEVGDYPEGAIYGNTVSNEAVLQMAPEAIWLMVTDQAGVLAGTAVDPREGGEWYVLFTASAPRGRGRGLARAVKQAGHRLAYDQGARAMRTTNEARNMPMRALNEAMGYRRVSGDLRLVRQMNSG
jgi:GNAT superfamily N-acetyltransferase